MRVGGPDPEKRVSTHTFPETQFIAVTAYQNEEVGENLNSLIENECLYIEYKNFVNYVSTNWMTLYGQSLLS